MISAAAQLHHLTVFPKYSVPLPTLPSSGRQCQQSSKKVKHCYPLPSFLGIRLATPLQGVGIWLPSGALSETVATVKKTDSMEKRRAPKKGPRRRPLAVSGCIGVQAQAQEMKFLGNMHVTCAYMDGTHRCLALYCLVPANTPLLTVASTCSERSTESSPSRVSPLPVCTCINQRRTPVSVSGQTCGFSCALQSMKPSE